MRLKYKLAFCGYMEKKGNRRRVSTIPGVFKSRDSLEQEAKQTVGWHAGLFDTIVWYRKRVTLLEWEQAK